MSKNIYVVVRKSPSFHFNDMMVSAHPTEEEAKMAKEEYLKAIPKLSRRHIFIIPVKWGLQQGQQEEE